jgi:hypothetical protein
MLQNVYISHYSFHHLPASLVQDNWQSDKATACAMMRRLCHEDTCATSAFPHVLDLYRLRSPKRIPNNIRVELLTRIRHKMLKSL